MDWQHSTREIATIAGDYHPRGVSPATVKGYRTLLAGRSWGNVRHRGPAGFALMALSRPDSTAAAVLRALDDLGELLTHPPGHAYHDPDRHLLARAARLLREGTPDEQREMRLMLRRAG